MKSIFVSALALAIAMPALAQNPSPAATPTSAEADAFVAAAEKEAFDFGVFGAQVAWVKRFARDGRVGFGIQS